ncbi:hypothetical protein L249_6613 [Ophiocordyceps polyrhachis-furcata BCC 54312]|uniref:Uncharacterized protein n=1 Tax=Ophiocordyceps polyrhachis-furcata BCC 54312 TaxID=1330021 RepID=A0A367LLZ6_9HYPO|nr:hypothetical protein L249_6613 [Ophiocordyceps polyrhachis-furcata BCC 54312]
MNTINNCPSFTLDALTSATPDLDTADDVDEPPEIRLQQPSPQRFQRTAIRPHGLHSSLLTKAIMGHSDDDHHDYTTVNNQRRRSMTSTISIASTADLSSDTGLTSPCRTNTPSPPLPEIGLMRLDVNDVKEKTPPKKRCIQFACAAKPQPPAAPAQVPRRSCIKFAAHASESSVKPDSSPPEDPPTVVIPPSQPLSLRKSVSNSPLIRPKFIRANSKDPYNDASQFHEFASGTAREEEWIRKGHPLAETTKITINDTLIKENRFRRLAAEAEEEEDQEAEAEADDQADEPDDDDDDDGDEDEEEDQDDGEDQDDDSNGYSTDEETGFAESDDEDDDDENMTLWTPGRVANRIAAVPTRRGSSAEPQSDSSAAATDNIRPIKTRRHKDSDETPDLPDSTDFVCGTLDEDKPLEEAYLSCMAARRNGKLRIIPQDIDPSFPASDPDDDDDDEDMYNPVAHDSDSDVLVHGEMEDLHHGQDRSRRTLRSAAPPKRHIHSPPPPKRHHIHHSPPPQKRHIHSPPPPKRHHIHHSPPPQKRHIHSPPPPKRHHIHHSPPPQKRHHHSPPPPLHHHHHHPHHHHHNNNNNNDAAAPRTPSPKTLFGRQSPRRARSPAPRALMTPVGSPRQGPHVQFQLAGRPNTTHTKSLPRTAALFRHAKKERNVSKSYHHHHDADMHVRGAIDIVKGLERKRQRRKEKFYQKYCNRARRGQIPERKPQPGRGAERMKELGLLMAGKKDQGNYVISI